MVVLLPANISQPAGRLFPQNSEPVLDEEVREGVEVLVRGEEGHAGLACEGCQHHIDLRACTTAAAEIQEDFAVVPRRPGIKRPDLDGCQEARKNPAQIVRISSSGKTSFDFAKSRNGTPHLSSHPLHPSDPLLKERAGFDRQAQMVCVQEVAHSGKTHLPPDELLGFPVCLRQRCLQTLELFGWNLRSHLVDLPPRGFEILRHRRSGFDNKILSLGPVVWQRRLRLNDASS